MEEEEDGMLVERTTNFSTVDRLSSAAYRGLGVTREDYFWILSDYTNLGGMVGVNGPQWKVAVENEYRRITSSSATSSTTTTNAIKIEEEMRSMTFEELRDAKLFEDSLRYIGVPVLMKDREGDIIGVWHHKAATVQHSSGLMAVPEGSVHFVMRNEGEDGVVSKE